MKILPLQFNKTFLVQKKLNDKQNKLETKKAFSSLECFASQNVSFCGKKPVYALDRNNQLIYFDSALRASLVLGLNDSNIASILKGRNYETNGYTFAYAKDIESTNDKGEKEINPEALKKLKENFDKVKTVPVYVVDYDGNLKRFPTQAKACAELGLSPSVISKLALGEAYASLNSIIIPAQDIELRDENNDVILNSNSKPMLDFEKIKTQLKRFSNAQFAPICTITYFGEIERFKDRQELSEKRDFNYASLSTYLKNGKPIKNRIVVLENDILLRDEFGKTSRDINGNYVYDIKKINSLLQVFGDIKIKPVKAKNVHTKETILCDSASDAGDKTGISKQMVSKCLKGGYPFGGYTFEYLYPTYWDSYYIAN